VPVIEIIPIAGARANNASLAGVAKVVNDHVELLGCWAAGSCASTLAQIRPDCLISDYETDVLAAKNPTSDGSSDSEKKRADRHVDRPLARSAVTTGKTSTLML
jgi:hypothetical protein